MPNEFYDFVPPLVVGSKARAGEVNNQFAAIEAAFDLLPADADSLVFGTNTLAIESGSGNIYVVTTADNPRGTLVEGEEVVFKATHQNTGASTLNRDGIGAVTLRRFNGDALEPADIVTGRYYAARYDAAQMQWRVLWPAQVTTVSGAITYAAPANDVGLSAPAEGVATSVLRSDVTLRLSQAITPTWTGVHTFSNTVNFDAAVDFDAAANFDAGIMLAGQSLAGANPSASIGLAAVNGTAVTYMRSDAAPALSQAITPTWSGVHTFSNTVNFDGAVDFDSTANFDGVVTFTSSIEVDGAANFDGAADFDSTANFDGATTFTNTFTSGNPGAIVISASAPMLELDQANGATNDRRWWFHVVSEQLRFQVANDARTSSTSWLTVDRTDNTVDSIALSATALSFTGVATFASAVNFDGPTDFDAAAVFDSTTEFNSTSQFDGIATFTNPLSGVTAGGLSIESTTPGMRFFETDESTDNKNWQFFASGGAFIARTAGDATGAANWLTVDRTGTTVDRVTFPTDSTAGPFLVGAGTVLGNTMANITSSTASCVALNVRNVTSGITTLSVHNEATSGNNAFIGFATEGGAGTTRGSITYNRGAGVVAYNTTCRENLKTNIKRSASAIDFVKGLEIVSFDWKNSDAKLPWFVTYERTEKLAPWACQNDGVDVSKLVPALYKAVQELMDKVEALESKGAKEKLN